MALSDASVFDELYRLFGIGTFTENGVRAFNKWRAGQIVRIRQTREKRRVDPVELIITARWCQARGIWIKEHWELYEHITDALKAHRAAQGAEEVKDLDEAISTAIGIEAQIPDSEWFDRLVRATGKARAEVYAEWESFSFSRRSGTAGTAGG